VSDQVQRRCYARRGKDEMGINIGVDIPQDRQSQINLALALYPLMKEKRPPVCESAVE